MFPIIVGLNHVTAPVEVREKVSFHPSIISNALQELNEIPAIQGVVLLSTCNRLEIYASTREYEAGIAAIKSYLARHSKLSEQEINKYLYFHTLYDAVRHLYRVVSGLDSMVLGETEILGQVADAYEKASQVKSTNKVLNVIFQNALAVGKRVRTETLIDQHPTSVSYTAVELAKQTFQDIAGKSILILGAGEMSASTARHLVANGASAVMVANRSYERAKALACEFGGKALHYSQVESGLMEGDIVIAATAATHFVLKPDRMERVMAARNYRPLLLIDIAVPRDIHPDVGEIKGVKLFDIDDLQGVVDAHKKARTLAALQGEEILQEEMERFMKWHNSLYAVPTIIALKEKGEKIRDEMLQNALRKLGPLGPKEEKVIKTMANSIISNLLHSPIANLKEAANTSQGHIYTEILQKLFDLDVPKDSLNTGWHNSTENEPERKLSDNHHSHGKGAVGQIQGYGGKNGNNTYWNS